MGVKGNRIKAKFERIIDNTNFSNELVMTSVSVGSEDSGGYSISEETTTNTTTRGIPANHIKSRLGLEKVGDVEEGEIKLLVKDEVSVNENDRVSFNDDVFVVRTIQKVPFNDVNIAKIIVLSKEVS